MHERLPASANVADSAKFADRPPCLQVKVTDINHGETDIRCGSTGKEEWSVQKR
jgi:hypothetical protein